MRVLDNFIIKLKKDTEKSLIKEEKAKAAKHGSSWNGNSRLLGSIKTKSTNNSASMSMNDYWYWVDKGREKGNVSDDGLVKIEDWIKRKGINPAKIIDKIKVDYAIKKKIAIPTKPTPFIQAKKEFAAMVRNKVRNKGYEGNSFYSKVINDGRIEQLNKDIGKEIKIDIFGKASK